MQLKIQKFSHIFFAPVDNSPLILFRIAFGFLIFLESVGAIFTGWVRRVMIEPDFTFTFIGFEWLQPLPGNGMYFYYALMGLFGLLVMAGLFYRFSMSMFTLMWLGVYLMQKSSYNNHYYLLILICLIMIAAPAHHYYSLDVQRRPALKKTTCPQWCIGIFIFQIGLVFTYAGIAKLYPGWLQGDFIRLVFSGKQDLPLMGPWLGQEWMVTSVVYGGLFYDLFIFPILLWRPTRWLGVGLSLLFHLFNSYVFQIGIFPYLMIAILPFFFPGESVRRRFFPSKPAVQTSGFAIPGLGFGNKIIIATTVLYLFIQVILPLRHWAFPGDVNWTEEGHRMSWHMMLRSKSGTASFKVIDPASKQEWNIRPQQYMTAKQVTRMATHPDMIWQFSQRLKREYEQKGFPQAEIYVDAKSRLNLGPYRQLIDPNVNLAKEKWARFKHKEWILL